MNIKLSDFLLDLDLFLVTSSSKHIHWMFHSQIDRWVELWMPESGIISKLSLPCIHFWDSVSIITYEVKVSKKHLKVSVVTCRITKFLQYHIISRSLVSISVWNSCTNALIILNFISSTMTFSENSTTSYVHLDIKKITKS